MLDDTQLRVCTMSEVDKPLRALIKRCRIRPGSNVRLKNFETDLGDRKRLPKALQKQALETVLSEDVQKLAAAQDLLFAADSWSILIILQAMDAAGKDSTIKHVMSGVNPQGCEVHSFKQPSAEELDHTFLWRCIKVLPTRGRIGIFNRSYYEEVLVVKVHPELISAERIPDGKVNQQFWDARYDDINRLERHLVRNGTLILKFFLHLSKEEQRKRFLKRVETPDKYWKFSINDLAERKFWDDYVKAYEQCLSATTTKWAPWYVIPADQKWVSRALVASVVTRAIRKLDLHYPVLSKEQRKQLWAARARLLKEKD
jgi:PPK2 family polyphosphate:nucleotide phosphotransferase